MAKDATTEPVRIEVGAETMVTASMTNEAVDALALEVGKPASAVNASDVMIVIDV